MALEETLWGYHGESRTAQLADVRTIIPYHIQRTVEPLSIYAVAHPIVAQCTHCTPSCAQPCMGALLQPLHTPNYRRGHIPRHYTRGPATLTSCPQRTAITPYHCTSSNTPGRGTVPLSEVPPPRSSDRRPPDEPTHASPGPTRDSALLSLKREATISRDVEGENHLEVEGLTEQIPLAAVYATAAASRLWEDCL